MVGGEGGVKFSRVTFGNSFICHRIWQTINWATSTVPGCSTPNPRTLTIQTIVANLHKVNIGGVKKGGGADLNKLNHDNRTCNEKNGY